MAKKILYAGGSILTTDEIAEAVLHYAAALANTGRASELDIPALDLDGRPTVTQVVIGPASQLVAESDVHRADIDATEFVREIRARTRTLEIESALRTRSQIDSR